MVNCSLPSYKRQFDRPGAIGYVKLDFVSRAKHISIQKIQNQDRNLAQQIPANCSIEKQNSIKRTMSQETLKLRSRSVDEKEQGWRNLKNKSYKSILSKIF